MTRYINTNSIIHKANSAIKLALLIVLSVVIFAIKSYLYLTIIMGLVALIFLLSKIHIKYYFRNIRYAVYFMVITFVTNILFLQDLSFSLMLSYRVFIMLMITQCFTLTTPPMKIAEAITALLYPLKIFKIKIEDISIMIIIALSFMPILREEFKTIKLAQKTKGYEPNFWNIKKYILCIFIPFMNNCFKRTEEISMALVVKGYDLE